MKAIINGKIILPNEIIENKILMFNEKIVGIFDKIPEDLKDNIEIIDVKNKYVSPGLIDLHIHGNAGHDFMNSDVFEIGDIEDSIVTNGVTGYLATTMTMSKDEIYKTLNILKRYIKNDSFYKARMLGIHLEGPFLNERYKGAQDAKYIISPSYDFIKDYEDVIKIITYAPEKDENLEFTKYISQNTDIVLSMGHTNASYDKACNAVKNGAKHVTHLFNAMTGLNHRDPGVVGASVLNGVKCELIADNIHVHKDLYELLVKTKNLEDILLITDAMEATNMPNGMYSIGGQPVKVENNCARLVSNDALAGSTLNLNKAVKNFYDNTSLKLEEVIQLASLNPAKALKIDKTKGSLEIGKDSDIAIFDENMECFMTIVEGKIKYEKGLVKMNKSELLEILTKSMNCSIAKWKNVDDAIKQNIEIFKLIDTSTYITDEEYEKLKQKSFIGK